MTGRRVAAALFLAVSVFAAGTAKADYTFAPQPGIDPSFGGLQDEYYVQQLRTIVPRPGGGYFAGMGSLGDGFFYANRFGADGKIIRDFGRNGSVYTRISELKDKHASALAEGIAMDGPRIVVAGYERTREGKRRLSGPAIVRFNPDGELDRSFGARGKVRPKMLVGGGTPHGVTVDRRGGILLAGGHGEFTSRLRSGLLVRYTATGKLDTRFGKGGRVFFRPKGPSNDYSGLLDVDTLPTGRILVGGYLQGRLFMARLRPNGLLDRGFGRGGLAFSPAKRFKRCLSGCIEGGNFTVTPGGGIVEIGSDLTLTKFSRNGVVDRSFGEGGVVHTSVGVTQPSLRLETKGTRVEEAYAKDIASTADGKLVLAAIVLHANKVNEGRYSAAVLRYSGTGELDESFGINGVVTRSPVSDSAARAIALDPQGRAVVAGDAREHFIRNDYAYSYLLQRVLPG